MKHKAMKSFENLSTQLVKLAIELSTDKDKEEGVVQNMIKPLRQELIVILSSIIRCLSAIFKL